MEDVLADRFLVPSPLRHRLLRPRLGPPVAAAQHRPHKVQPVGLVSGGPAPHLLLPLLQSHPAGQGGRAPRGEPCHRRRAAAVCRAPADGVSPQARLIHRWGSLRAGWRFLIPTIPIPFVPCYSLIKTGFGSCACPCVCLCLRRPLFSLRPSPSCLAPPTNMSIIQQSHYYGFSCDMRGPVMVIPNHDMSAHLGIAAFLATGLGNLQPKPMRLPKTSRFA